jgi:hypothetical protein
MFAMTNPSLAAGAAGGLVTPARLVLVLAEAGVLLRLAVPIMLIALVNMGLSVTDTLMVSAAFGAEALAAVAVGSDFYSILFYLGAGTIGGLAPFYAAAVARADPAERARLERTGRVIVLGLAVVLVPVVWTAPDWLGVLGLDRDLLADGRGYTRAMALALVPMLGVMLYRTILTAAERPRVFLKVTAAMLPLNALGNLVFMHGLGPIPALGPTGSGRLDARRGAREPCCTCAHRALDGTRPLKPGRAPPRSVGATSRRSSWWACPLASRWSQSSASSLARPSMRRGSARRTWRRIP